jgi:hypothetical protein
MLSKDDALLQYSKICELPEPESLNVKNLHEWLRRHRNTKLNIHGPGSSSWGDLGGGGEQPETLWTQFQCLLRSIFWPKPPDKDLPDLVIPGKVKDIDSLTRWIVTEGLPFWHIFREVLKKTKARARKERLLLFGWYFLRYSFGLGDNQDDLEGARAKRDSSTSIFTLSRLNLKIKSITRKKQAAEKSQEEQPSLVDYSKRNMIRFTNFVATLVACLLPIVAIVVLSKLHTQPKILGFIALFTAIFAIGIMWLTDASTSRTEIFTATAA